MFSEQFDYTDKHTAKAEIGDAVRDDALSPTIRVLEYDATVGGFQLSIVPPPSDEEQTTIIEHLDENGFLAEVQDGLIYVTGQTSR